MMPVKAVVWSPLILVLPHNWVLNPFNAAHYYSMIVKANSVSDVGYGGTIIGCLVKPPPPKNQSNNSLRPVQTFFNLSTHQSLLLFISLSVLINLSLIWLYYTHWLHSFWTNLSASTAAVLYRFLWRNRKKWSFLLSLKSSWNGCTIILFSVSWRIKIYPVWLHAIFNVLSEKCSVYYCLLIYSVSSTFVIFFTVHSLYSLYSLQFCQTHTDPKLTFSRCLVLILQLIYI